GDGVRLEVPGVDVEVVGHPLGQVELGMDRVDRALVHAGAAVDAGRRVDVELLGRGEVRVARPRTDALDRADRDARTVLAASLVDYEGHDAGALSRSSV